ncbi:hypothetical protein FVA96_24360 [Escherichia coli]|nr:hypothetical protein [Escherichia coli]
MLPRWKQAAALQPFFRGHSAKGTKLFGEKVTAAIRTAIQQSFSDCFSQMSHSHLDPPGTTAFP